MMWLLWKWKIYTLIYKHDNLTKLITHWKRLWCWERLKAGEEGDNRRWDGWMASLTQWTWVWANCRRRWWSGKPGMLQPMGSQRLRHDFMTEQWIHVSCSFGFPSHLGYYQFWKTHLVILIDSKTNEAGHIPINGVLKTQNTSKNPRRRPRCRPRILIAMR